MPITCPRGPRSFDQAGYSAETPQLAVQRLAIAALKTEIPVTYADMIQYIENSIDVIIQAGRHDGRRGITEFYLPGASETGAS